MAVLTEAPERDVVRVEERTGPRGGRTLVLHLSCGCFLTRSSRLPPPKRARCIPCSVIGDRTELEIAILKRTIEIAVDTALGEVARQQGGIGEPIATEARGAGIRAGQSYLDMAMQIAPSTAADDADPEVS